MGSTSWFRPERIRRAAAYVVADGAAWRSRMRALLLGPIREDSAQSVVCGMGLLIFVDSESAWNTQQEPCEESSALLPRQRAASD